MKIKNVIIIVSILILLALLKIVYLSPKPNKTQAGAPPPTALISITVVKSSEFKKTITSSGSIAANEEVILNPEIAGKIISINFKEGRAVKKGQLLVKINDADLQAILQKQLSIQKIYEEKEVRLKELLSVKGVSQEEYDMALSLVQQGKSDINLTKVQILKTEIRAPFDGVVGLKSVSEGDFINSTDVIASIQQLNPVKIDFSIPEKYAYKVHVSDTVSVNVAGSGRTYIGKIYAIDPMIDAATRALKVRALIENRTNEIYAGAYADVSIILQSEDAIVVPSMSVIAGLRGQTTYVIKNGKAKVTPITIGVRTDSTVEVLSGLKQGDTIAILGIMGLKPDVDVKIQNLKK
jgi:membrane fusion protein (multidrug efflux system)